MMNSFTASDSLLKLILLGVILVLAGCASVEEQYAGFRVVDKQEDRRTDRVPIRIMACVDPRNRIICERRFGGPPLDPCNLTCRTPPNQWLEQPVGYGGYEDRESVRYFLVLQSPTGTTQRVETIKQDFDAVVVGQVMGRQGQAPSVPPPPVRQSDAEPTRPPSSAAPPSAQPTSPAAASSDAVGRPQPPAALTPAMPMAEAQRRLARLGFDPGPPDGLIGPRTIAALRAFQRSAGLEVTGQLDEPTRAELAKR